jgi:hypothetical protein
VRHSASCIAIAASAAAVTLGKMIQNPSPWALTIRPSFSSARRQTNNRDIWRAANLLIRKHRADAEVVAARRADEMLERGDREGQLVWLRIMRAIVELQALPVGKPN